ncbi:MAG: PEP-CTERM sorting domain-containing protein [Verrucomicrobiota bacterium]
MKTTLTILVASVTAALAQEFVFLDDNMDAPDYRSFSFSNPTNDADISFETINGSIPTDGNPGSYLQIAHFHDLDRDEFGEPFTGDFQTDLSAVYLFETFTYDPSVSGPISNIAFEIDVRSDADFSVSFAIGNATTGSGNITFADNFLDPFDSDWQTLSRSIIDNSTASTVDFAGSDLIEFGFSIGTTAELGDDPEEFFIDVDNFRVILTPVPEPSTALLGVLGILTLLRRRR